jgi:hypothetical protein
MREEGFITKGLRMAAENARWLSNQSFYNKPDSAPLEKDQRNLVAVAILGFARAHRLGSEVTTSLVARSYSIITVGEMKTLITDVEDLVAASEIVV